MCLITNQINPIILKEDRIVYKKLKCIDNILYSPFNYFEWELNILYETKIKKTNNYSYFDSEDLKHIIKITGKLDMLDLKTFIKKANFISLGEGFHSFDSYFRAMSSRTCGISLYKCIIPKGSEIYYNPSNLVVSNKIIIKEKLNHNPIYIS